MADEGKARLSLQVRKDVRNFYKSLSFNFDITGEAGETPGEVLVTTTGVNISLSVLTSLGGVILMENLSEDYRVEYGIHDGLLMHPLGEILPEEAWLLRLSRNLGVEEQATGTGTTGIVNNLFFQSYGGSARVVLNAFDR